MNEEERIKEEKLKAKKAQEQLKATLRMVLEPPAYERMMNVAIANNELFLTAAKNILTLFERAGGKRLTEEEVVTLLRVIKGQREKKTTITFHKK